MGSAVYYIVFLFLLLILLQQDQAKKICIHKIIKRRNASMTSELLLQYVGHRCLISTGSFGTAVDGRIVRIDGNWIEVETKKGNELLNADFVQHIKPVLEKK